MLFLIDITGGDDGVIRMWQYLVDSELSTFTSTGGINSLRFSTTGSRFGAASKTGYIELWNANIGAKECLPFYKVCAFKKYASDLVFLNAGNVISACGFSPETKR